VPWAEVIAMAYASKRWVAENSAADCADFTDAILTLKAWQQTQLKEGYRGQSPRRRSETAATEIASGALAMRRQEFPSVRSALSAVKKILKKVLASAIVL